MQESGARQGIVDIIVMTVITRSNFGLSAFLKSFLSIGHYSKKCFFIGLFSKVSGCFFYTDLATIPYSITRFFLFLA